MTTRARGKFKFYAVEYDGANGYRRDVWTLAQVNKYYKQGAKFKTLGADDERDRLIREFNVGRFL
jgi:hypothetical protein